jgi:ankyrin repeat protein
MENKEIYFKIFELLKNNNFSEFLNLIKNDKNINLDIYDENNNYIIHYLINNNKIDIIKYIFENMDIRIDIIDNDGRNILYYPIKFNYIDLLKLILQYNKNSIGINIINNIDNLGYTPLFYSIVNNNIQALEELYNYNANINLLDNNNNNIFQICLKYNKNDMIIYLLKKEYLKNNDLDIYTINNENILQLALIYENEILLKYIMNLKLSDKFLNNRETDYGIVPLHQSIIVHNYNIANQLILKGVDINIVDYIGNSALHYAIYEKQYDILKLLLNKNNLNYKLDYNQPNSTGQLPIHLVIEFINIEEQREIFIQILKNSNLNYMNNMGITPLFLIIEKNLWLDNDIYKILSSGDLLLNIFIKNNNNISPFDIIDENQKDKFINMIIDSYYYNLIKLNNNNKLTEKWEKYCSSNDLTNLLKEINKKSGKEISFYCKDIIKDMIINKKRSIPKFEEIDINIIEGIYVKGCFYTGSTIDILCGLLYLNSLNKNISFIIDYPLTKNNKLIDYYKQLGLDYSFKDDFINIEISWIYQKIIYPTNFDFLLSTKIKDDNRYIVIPLGIVINNGSHANIILIDKKNKTIERFEPNGKNSPRGFYYNQNLLDNILKIKFNNIINDYIYLSPNDFLDSIGYQLLEISEEEYKCKQIGDPNGFCAVWCVWWIEMRINNSNIKPNELFIESVKNIKYKNMSFKELIRNYSHKIVELRDKLLNKYNLTIDEWKNNKYTIETINNIEEEVILLFS